MYIYSSEEIQSIILHGHRHKSIDFIIIDSINTLTDFVSNIYFMDSIVTSMVNFVQSLIITLSAKWLPSWLLFGG